MAETGRMEWAGVRVLELADGDAQVCGRLFADAGADVIKVETPAGWRSNGRWSFGGDEPDPNRGAGVWHLTRHKRSLTLNLETELGRHLFKRLIPTTDVLIESFPPGYLNYLGCGFDQLLSLNPRLIYISLTPFGKQARSSDAVPAERANGDWGEWLRLGRESGESSGHDRVFQPGAWEQAGRLAYLRAGAALLEREATGAGVLLDITLQDAMVLNDTCPVIHHAAMDGGAPGIAGTPASLTDEAPGWLFRCRDGKRIFAPLAEPDPEVWARFIAWLEGYDLAGPLRTHRERHLPWIQSNLGLIYRVIQRFCRELPSIEVLRGARAVGLDWQPADTPTGNGITLPWTPAGWLPRSSLVLGTPPLWPAQGQLPARGEHTSSILVKELGCHPDSLADLAADSVI